MYTHKPSGILFSLLAVLFTLGALHVSGIMPIFDFIPLIVDVVLTITGK